MNSATKHPLSHTFLQEISECMKKIELINKHTEVVGGIKTSFALQDDMVESNIFLPHLGEVRVCEDASNTDRANLTKKNDRANVGRM
jgi:hypothetical protein